eukprot:CAMPEP_0206628886 /NCGR_PEP_ID=MMETSP0325_2-20121206/66755_1 /ASSEMBLY_ACC=CAM_ASM_000347 /TAXON_ID=2866 /ORGANISM="Crypthecodinium cohnii, Strain Seligo" /LENGTH=209 /DNA_ID=CAMNT_0054153661 /DNA_START=93 /DNA_END=724 /DNA_ORIENTATION=+
MDSSNLAILQLSLAGQHTGHDPPAEKSLRRKADRHLLAKEGAKAVKAMKELIEMVEWKDVDDVGKEEQERRLTVAADAYVRLAEAYNLLEAQHPALESLMRARRLYTMRGTPSFEMAAGAAFEARLMIQADRARDAIGLMTGALKVAEEAQSLGMLLQSSPEKTQRFVEDLRGGAAALRESLVLSDDEAEEESQVDDSDLINDEGRSDL